MKRLNLLLFLSVITILFVIGCFSNAINKNNKQENIPDVLKDPNFEIHYIDVGQADAALILCEGHSMLIDGGNPDNSRKIAAYLKKCDVSHIDYIVCSHAHDDHVGGLPAALSVATVGAVYAPKTESNIKSYRSFKNKSLEKGLSIITPTPKDIITLGRSTVQFMGPIAENVTDLNNTSIVLKITYGKTSFLFTGDAEREEEQSILSQNFDLSSTVLKVGHHGSPDSTTYPFLREIMPQYAIISVGENSYGHPSDSVLSRLDDAGVQVFRTDLDGDIIAISNGTTVEITTSKNSNASNLSGYENDSPKDMLYIGNLKSKKVHTKQCTSLPLEKNRVYFSSLDEALNNGYSPCKNCIKNYQN